MDNVIELEIREGVVVLIELPIESHCILISEVVFVRDTIEVIILTVTEFLISQCPALAIDRRTIRVIIRIHPGNIIRTPIASGRIILSDNIDSTD